MAALATVTAISGLAWLRSADGSLRELRPGSTIPPDSEIVTATGSSVTLAVAGAAPVTIGENRSVAISDDFIVPADPADATVRAGGGGDTGGHDRLCASAGSASGRSGIGG